MQQDIQLKTLSCQLYSSKSNGYHLFAPNTESQRCVNVCPWPYQRHEHVAASLFVAKQQTEYCSFMKFMANEFNKRLLLMRIFI